MDAVSFEATPDERDLAHRIAQRAAETIGAYASSKPDPLDIEMDLIATHANGCPLDFVKLSNADDFNLLHDVSGIGRHLDRSTGELRDHFWPRCAQKD